MIYLYHIRKCGGRSLIRSILGQIGDAATLYTLATCGQYNTRAGVIAGWNSKPSKDMYFAWSHNPFDDVELPDGAFTMAVFRDPAERVLSYYGMLRMYQLGASGASSLSWEEPHFMLWQDLNEFVHKAPRHRLSRQLYMFSAEFNVNQAAERIINLSHYFKLENYAAGLACLAQKLGVPALTEYRVNEPARSAEVLQRTAEELPAAKDYLLELLEPEYKLMELIGNGN